MVFAGIWEKWKSPEGSSIESCSILTTHSNKLIKPMHGRQPVILHPEEVKLWLEKDIVEPEVLAHLYHPYPAERMEMYQVSMLVNSPKNDGPDLINRNG